MNVVRIAAVALACGLVIVAPTQVRAQKESQPQYQGTNDCRDCHRPGLDETDKAKGVGSRVFRTEFAYWHNADHHADAYKSLKEKRGQLISERFDGDVTKQARCIQCHTTSTTAPQFAEEGVGCEACHGPSSKWKFVHNKPDEWRNLTAKDKTKDGWIDVRSPLTRAELCTSCHIGNAQLDRLVTHDMYVAGHPPLAGFELETFADKMPRHWRYSGENAKPPTLAYPRTRNMLVAAAVSLRVSVELAAADASPPSKRWPELARLDCFACHHDLQTAGVREVDKVAPGRPPIAIIALPIVESIARTWDAPRDGELKRGLQDLKSAFTIDPFGDAVKIVSSGNSLIAITQGIEKKIASENLTVTASEARTFLHVLAGQAAGQDFDRENARQCIAAWIVCYRELVGDANSGLSEELKSEVKQQISGGHTNWLQFAEATPYSPNGSNIPGKTPYQAVLDRHYPDRFEFDARTFQKLMHQLELKIN